MRSGSAGDPFRWYTSQPPKNGPLTSHFSRLPSEFSTNAPLCVPTSTRTLLILFSFLTPRCYGESACRGDRHTESVPGFGAPAVTLCLRRQCDALAAARSQLTIHGIPNRSTHMPKREIGRASCRE